MNPGRLRAAGRAGSAGAAVAVLLIAAGLFWLQWMQYGRQAMPDTYWYTRQAVIYSGAGPARADAAASALECASRNQYARALGMRQACRHYPAGRPDPRYARIFTTRPGYSLLAAPLMRLEGPWRAMMLATGLAALLAAVLLYAAVRALGGSRVAGIASTVLLFAFPTGYWITRMLPEGAMLAGCLAAGIGFTLLWPGDGEAAMPGRGRMTAGIALASAGLLWTYLVKSANGFLLSAVLLAGGTGLAAWARLRMPEARWRWAAWAMGALGLAGTAGWAVVSVVAHLPSFTTTIQDMASSHFRRRLTPSPVGYLLHRDAWFIPHWALALVRDVWALPVAAAGIAALVWACRARAVPWLLVAVTGPLAVAAHPLDSEADRLVLPVWLAVTAGLALGADRAARQAIWHLATRRRGTHPAIQPGAQPGIQPGAHPGIQPGAQPGPQPGAQPGTQPGRRTVAGRSPGRPAADNVSSPPERS